MTLAAARRFQGMNFGPWVGCAEDGAASHENVGSRLDEASARFAVDASVHFDECVRPAAVNEFAQAARFVDGVFDKLLPAKTGIYRHEHDEVEIGNDFFQTGHGGMRVERHAGHHAFGFDLLNDAVQVGAGFVVYVHYLGAQSLYFTDELLGLHDHQVDVERFAGGPGHGLHNGETERDVGHEYAVHDVEVEPVAFAFVEHFDVALQVGEIGREQRGGNQWGHNGKVRLYAGV